ncbi:MAG: hypothetical protein U0R26_10595 [Solirubrobacterales bacterium]
MSSERTVLGKHGPSSFGEAASACDRWLRGPLLAGAAEEGGAWLQRARGVALAGAGFTLAMSAWKAIGPITTSDVFLIAAVLLLLPRFSVEGTKRFWFLAVAVALIVVGGAIGTLVESSDEIGSSGDVLVRFALASFGAMLLITCWRPDLRAIRSFAWLWVAGAVISAFVAFAIPDLHRFLRPSGLTPHPNHLAIISVIVFGVALGLVVSERRRIAAWTAATAAAILFAAVVVSGSRAGLGAAVLVAVLVVAATGEEVDRMGQGEQDHGGHHRRGARRGPARLLVRRRRPERGGSPVRRGAGQRCRQGHLQRRGLGAVQERSGDRRRLRGCRQCSQLLPPGRLGRRPARDRLTGGVMIIVLAVRNY